MTGRKTTVRVGRATKKPKRILADDAYWNVPFLDRYLGYDKHGPRLIRKAREGFRALGEPFEFALSSLDLAGFYLRDRELDEYEALAADTLAFLESFGDTKLLEALSALSRDVPVSAGELRTTRRAVEDLGDGGW